jgi:hypothetical protein
MEPRFRGGDVWSGMVRLLLRADFSISPSTSGAMRGLNLLDVLIIVIVVALLVLAARSDFARYAGRVIVPPATPTPHSAQ